MHNALHYGLIVAVVLAVLAAGFLAGHKWRKDYAKALDQYQNLTSRSSAVATSTSTSHGNQVVVNVDGGRELGPGPREFWLPNSVRPGVLSGPDRRTEALADGDDGGISEPNGIYSPTRVGRVLFGNGRFNDRDSVGRESGSRGDGG
jgi:hypothetical protein